MTKTSVQLSELMSTVLAATVQERELWFVSEEVFAEALIRASSLPTGSRERFCVELLAYMRAASHRAGEAAVPLLLQLAALLRRTLED